MAIKLPDPGASLNLSPTQSRSQAPGGLSGLARLAATAAIGREPRTASTALVKEVAQVQETQRQALLNRLLERLAGVRSLPEGPQKTQQLARLAGEQQLLQSPQLKLLRLEVHQQSLVTYSDRPLVAGESIKVLLKGQQLVQLPLEANRAHRLLKADSPGGAIRGRDLPSGIGQAAVNQNTGRHASAQSAPSLSPGQVEKLAQTLRSVLPLAEKPDLSPILPLIEQMSPNRQRQIFSPNLQEALKRAAVQLRGPEQLTRPEGLRRALENSGVGLEHKLAQILSTKNQPQGGTANDKPRSLAQVLGQDWKALLLKVLHQTTSDLNSLGSRPHARPEQLPDLSQLLGQAAQQMRTDGQQKTLQIQLLQSLHQATLQSLARVQLAQLQGLGAPQAQAEGAQPSQSLSLEIPLRMGQETLPLFMYMEQDWYQKQEEKRRSAGKVRQWQVSLSFDLPELGPFYAQVTVRGEQVGARLWAERETSSQKIQNHLSRLQERLTRDGVEVTRLEVHTGAPPRRRTQIHYTLVDVTT